MGKDADAQLIFFKLVVRFGDEPPGQGLFTKLRWKRESRNCAMWLIDRKWLVVNWLKLKLRRRRYSERRNQSAQRGLFSAIWTRVSPPSGLQELPVEVGVAGDHLLDGEVREDALAAGGTHSPAE